MRPTMMNIINGSNNYCDDWRNVYDRFADSLSCGNHPLIVDNIMLSSNFLVYELRESYKIIRRLAMDRMEKDLREAQAKITRLRAERDGLISDMGLYSASANAATARAEAAEADLKEMNGQMLNLRGRQQDD